MITAVFAGWMFRFICAVSVYLPPHTFYPAVSVRKKTGEERCVRNSQEVVGRTKGRGGLAEVAAQSNAQSDGEGRHLSALMVDGR